MSPPFQFPTSSTPPAHPARSTRRSKKAIGNVPNTFAAIAAHGPARPQVGSRRRRRARCRQPDQARSEVIKLVISAAGGCDYCVAAPQLSPQTRRREPGKSLSVSATGSPPAMPSATRWSASSASSRSPAGHRQRRGLRRDQGRWLQRRPAGGDQPGVCDHRLHQRFSRINDTEIDFPAVA